MLLKKKTVTRLWLEGSDMDKMVEEGFSLDVSITEVDDGFEMSPNHIIRDGESEPIKRFSEPLRSAYSLPISLTREYTY